LKQTDPQLKLRVPPELMEKIRKAAEEARRPISSEIVDRLESAYAPNKKHWWSDIKQGQPSEITQRLSRLEERVEELGRLCIKLAGQN
jgi:hypothetical protein